MKQVNKHTCIGIDSLEIVVNAEHSMTMSGKRIYDDETGTKIMEIKSIGESYFRASICLPHLIRENNIQPFGVFDENYLHKAVEKIKKKLIENFGIDIENATVTKVEVNTTATLKNPKNVERIMNLLALMFLEAGEKLYITAHGKKEERYSDVPLSYDILRNTQQIESVHTPRLSNNRFSWKFYDKGLEQDIQEQGILRLEQIHNSRSLDFARVPRQLDLFLTYQNIRRMVELYKHDFEKFFINVYWENGNNRFTDKCINKIMFEMKEEPPLCTAKIHRDLLAIDFGFFERACYKFYSNKKTAQQTIRRVKNSGKVEICTGAVSELVQIFRAILQA